MTKSLNLPYRNQYTVYYIPFVNDDDSKLKRNIVGIYNFQTNELNVVRLVPLMNIFWLHLEPDHTNHLYELMQVK